ncbi:MAG: hypothetical protein ACOCX7_00740 [Bacteroidota bacterium]
MKKFGIILIIAIVSVAASINIYSKESKKSAKKIMIGTIMPGPGVDTMVVGKAEPGLALAVGLSREYVLIPNRVRDSIARELAESGQQPTLSGVAKELGVEYIAFVTFSQLKNMLRADIALAMPSSKKNAKNGVGYSLLHFVNQKSGRYLYDPSILESLQRAFADALGRPRLYDSADGSLRVRPAATLVIGGIYFQNNEDLPQWNLFKDKTLNSYDFVETVFEAAVESPEYAVYDVPSRDSIYAMANMYGVENYRSPTRYEIEALYKFEVEAYITGVFRRSESGAEIELHLCDVNKDMLNIKKTVEGTLEEDSIKAMRDRVKYLTRRLLGIGVQED